MRISHETIYMSDKELTVLGDLPQVFEFIPEPPELWAEAGKISFGLRRKGLTTGLADCFIAVAASRAHVPLATLDGHFQALKKPTGISLYPLHCDLLGIRGRGVD